MLVSREESMVIGGAEGERTPDFALRIRRPAKTQVIAFSKDATALIFHSGLRPFHPLSLIWGVVKDRNSARFRAQGILLDLRAEREPSR